MRPYWEGLQQETLLAQRCESCNERFYPPQAHCPVCLSKDYRWFELSGKGTLYSWTEVHFRPSPTHVIGIIDLEEKIGRSIAKIEAKADLLKIGVPMNAVFLKTDDVTVLAWKPE